MSQYGFYFDKEKCVGCRACEVACQVWNGAVQTVKWRNVTSVSRAESPCKKACPRTAISKNADTGAVTVDRSRCVGCMLCLWACPFGAPQLGLHGRMEKCTFCEERPVGKLKRACEEICPQQAIVSGRIEELSLRSKQVVAERLSWDQRAEVVLGHEET